MKTCEEYVLNELANTKELLNKAYETITALQKENKELKEPKAIDGKEIKFDTYKMSEQPNYYYYLSVESYSYFNDVIKRKGKNPEWLRECLTDDDKLIEFSEMIVKKSYSSDPIADITRHTYDVILADYYGNTHIIDMSKESSYLYKIDDRRFFLDEEKAKTAMKEKLTQEIENYFKYKYDEKFVAEEKKND